MHQMATLHDELYQLRVRIVQLSEESTSRHREQLDALHDQAYALGDRIARMREEVFGSIEPASALLLTESVVSIPVSRP